MSRFWLWYEKYYTLNVGLAALLFVLQLIHLYWLTTAIVLPQLIGKSWFSPSPVLELLIVLVDYAEIPALLTVSAVYFNEIRKQFNWKSLLFLLFLNSQWLHLFWITDEFVIGRLADTASRATVLPLWLAVLAIVIDYFELPVMYDTVKKFFMNISTQKP